MATGFGFKLDSSQLPKLQAMGENYVEWRAAWTRTFRYNNLWAVISGKSVRPANETTEAFEAWQANDDKAMVILLSAIHSDLVPFVTTCDTAQDAWNYLSGRFDRDTGNTSIHLFRLLTNLRYHDGENLRSHLDEFNQLWTRMAKRTLNSKQAVAKAMKPMFDSDEVKGSIFLASLPDSMDHIIDNLSTKDITKFVDIQPRMLDISEKHSLESIDSAAYAARTNPRNRSRNASNKSQPSQPTAVRSYDSNDECTFCKKHNFTFVGHVYTNCRRVKAQESARLKPRIGTVKKQRTQDGKANTAINLDESDTDTVAFTAFALAVQPINANGKRPLQVSAYASVSPSAISSPGWLLDSGASRHMSGYKDDFSRLEPAEGIITIAGDVKLPIEGFGTVRLRCRMPDGSTSITELTNVIYSSELRGTQLFSWPYIKDKGCSINGKGNDLFISKPDGKPVVWAKYTNGIMKIQLDDSESMETQTAIACFASFEEFHHAIGHYHVANPGRLYKDADLIPAATNFHCVACHLSKSTHHKPTGIVARNTTKPFELIHSDLSGIFSTPSIGGARYFISFIDDATRFTWVKFLTKKTDATQIIKDFVAYATNQFTNVRRFRSDNGGEYVNKELTAFFESKGIVHETSSPYGHESNGVAERLNRTIVTAARTMLSDDSLLRLWAEAVHTAVFLKNIAPHAAVLTTPYEALMSKKPSIKHLHPFGQPVYLHIPTESRQPGTKLLHRAERGLFVGYGQSTKIFRIYIPSRNTVVRSQDVTFEPFAPAGAAIDNVDLLNLSHNNRPVNDIKTESLVGEQQSRSEPTPASPVAPIDSPKNQAGRRRAPPPIAASPKSRERFINRTMTESPTQQRLQRSTESQSSTSSVTTRSGRTVKPSDKARGLVAIDDHHDGDEFGEHDPAHESITAFAFAARHFDDCIPSTIAEAQKTPLWPEWSKAIAHEIQSHIDNGTWRTISGTIKSTTNVVGSRWVFDIKRNADGDVIRYKARLVAQGFSQVYGIDFFDTYAPVVRYDSLRILLRLAAMSPITEIHQMDVDTAYLNSILHQRIYMRLPKHTPGLSTDTVELYKTLYGLKQSGREWFGTLIDWLISIGLAQAAFDPCVFIGSIILAIYVDDLLLIGPITSVQAFKSQIGSRFKCKDLGQVKYLLGMEITITKQDISIGQLQYALRVLKRFDMHGCNSRQTPLDPNSFPNRTPDETPADTSRQCRYQQIVGCLGYLVTCSRPDLAFTTTMLSSFSSNPSELHLKLAMQVLRYVKGTTSYKLTFPRMKDISRISMTMFADASWGTDPDNAKSFSGYLLRINDATVSWSSKRQSCVARSTCEAEYMACSYASCHLIWAKQSITNLIKGGNTQPARIPPSLQFKLLTDSEPALSLIRDHRINARSKHIAIHYHFVRERYLKQEFDIGHIPSAENLADICTKALPRPTLQHLVQAVGLVGD